MRRFPMILAGTLAGLALAGAAVCAARRSDVPAAAPAATGAALVERGSYLVRTSGCYDCHTPFKMGPDGPAPDLARGLSGHPQEFVINAPPPAPAAPWMVTSSGTNTAHAGPWGVSFTANLTPDKETGIGDWTLETFRSALRTGRHLGRGRPILPPMPWPVYGQMTDADLEAIFTFLMSQPAVKNRVPEPLPPATEPPPPAPATPR